MDTILQARIPLPHPSPSAWRIAKGCSWRLSANRSRPNIASLSLHLVRHSPESSAYLSVLVETSDMTLQPVQNLYVSQLCAPHPCDLIVHFMNGEASKSIQLPPICFPHGQKELPLKIHISMEEQPNSPTAIREATFEDLVERCSWSGSFPCPVTYPTSFGSPREGFTHRSVPSNTTSITWIEEEDTYRLKVSASQGLLLHSSKGFNESTEYRHISTNNVGRAKSTRIETSHCCDAEHVLHGVELNIPNQRGGRLEDSQYNPSDVKVVVQLDEGENVEFHLQRSVLAKASPVFRAMLSCNMRERLRGKIELSLFNPSTISLAVRHMNGEHIYELMDSQRFNLYRFSHQFEVAGLAELSRQNILASINCTTCIDILKFGVFFDDMVLKERSSAFITEHFSEIASEDHALASLCSLPPKLFLSFIESDSLCATELEAFLVSMKWLSHNEDEASIMDIVRRIRWNLMQSDMFRTALNSPMVLRFPSLRKFLRSSRMTISMHLNGSTPQRRRLLGHPTAFVSIPVVQRPPRAVLHTCQRTADDLICSQSHRTNFKRNRMSNMVDKLFQHEGLNWSCRVELGECQAKGCSQPRLSLSLWLEQNESGLLSMDELLTVREFNSFPIRVKTRYLVWNSMGGQLHKGIVDFTFRSSGWASGWCVQDVLGGHTKSDAFFRRLSSLEYTKDVVHVAIEILDCENG